VTHRLVPGVTGRMRAYVRNTGVEPLAVTLQLMDLTDAGGAYNEPERESEPGGDVADLSANIVLSISFDASVKDAEPSEFVARGTLRELAADGRILAAVGTLGPAGSDAGDIGVWQIELSVPESADNRIQGDKTSCAFAFGAESTP